MNYRPDWADRLASSTTRLRSEGRWEYEDPMCAWEAIPWFVRWPLAVAAVVYFGGALIVPLVILLLP